VNVCPLTYQPCAGRYSSRGLRRLSRNLADLRDFPYTADEQLKAAETQVDKISIQGVQPKLSARLSPASGSFVLVNRGGTYILKPPNPPHRELPQNEDLTMRLAAAAGIKVPLHGLVYAKGGTLTYFIKRFDRAGRRGKLAMEDFAQLTGSTRETKYASSMEKVASVIERFCTFPVIDKSRLFRLTLFNFLVGNEDMHLKNFSLIHREGKIELSPAYDLLNTTIALGHPTEEIALPLRGKKNRLDRDDLIEYFGRQRLDLTDKTISRITEEISRALPVWEETVHMGFLSNEMKNRYQELVNDRSKILRFS